MKPLKVGITGGIGSGKSVICRILKIMGYPVFDADSIAKNLYRDDYIQVAVTGLLGEKAYLNNGEPNKEFIRSIIFNNPELLISINKILHPAVNLKFQEWIKDNSDAEVVFKEAAIMFESGSYKNLDFIVGILADEATRMKRVMIRDHKSETEIREIMHRQMDQNEMASKCHYTIMNDENQPLMPQIIHLLKSLKSQIK